MKFISALFILITSSTAFAGDFTVTCPSIINVEQKFIEIPDGWSGSVPDSKHLLRNIGFSEGDPVNLVLLAPTSGKKTRDADLETWEFVATDLDGHWVYCEYGLTKLALAKKLPDNVKSCSVTYGKRSASRVEQNVKCK